MTFRDLEVFDIRPHFDSVQQGGLDDFAFHSRGYGVATPWRSSGAVRRTITLPLLLQGLDTIGALRRFADRHSGRMRPFWLPAFINDFGLLEDAAAAATELTVEGHEFATKHALGAQWCFIALLTRAGKLECYGVTAVASDLSGDNDVLTLDRGLDSDLVAADTICSPLVLARFANDDLEYEYASGDVITGELQFIEVAVEYPAATAGASAATSAHLGSRPVFLYRITDGVTTLYLADYGVDITAASQTWQASDIEHASLHSTSDMLGDAVDVTLRTDDADHPLRAYLNEYNLANFTLEVFETDIDDLAALDLSAPAHLGRLEAVDFGREGEIRLEVSSLFRLSEREIPTIRMQRTCNWRTFEGGCGAVEADFTTAGTITAINADPAYVEAAEFGAKATAESDANWFALGKVTVGAEIRICTGQDGDRLYLNYPFLSAAVSDSISAVAGDDKRIGTCEAKFGQLAAHLAAPYMPNSNPQLDPLKQPVDTGGKKG